MRATSDPTRGAWGWTSGEQTYLRVRPSKADPIVARVPHATKVFVWGKYNGWYRVETVDHKFGWVFHDFLKCPKAAKVAPLTHAKAVTASNRASSQTLYGSTTTLQSYYGRHRSSGAARGLAQHGVRLASSPSAAARRAAASRAAATRRARLASAKARASKPDVRLASGPSTLNGAAHVRGVRIASAATHGSSPGRFGSRGRVNPNLRLASVHISAEQPSEMRSERAEQGRATEPRLASGAHFEVRQSTRGYSASPSTPRAQSSAFDGAASASAREAAPADSIVLDPTPARPQAARKASGPARGSANRAGRAGGAKASAQRATPRVATRPSVATRPVSVPRKALAAVRPVIRVAAAPVAIPVATPAVVIPVVAPPVMAAPASVPVVEAPIAAAVARPAAKPAAKKLTAAQARARARQQKRAWLWKQQQERRNRRLASRGSSRDRLRSRMGAATLAGRGVPPLSPNQTRPITPEELMRARDSHLANSAQAPNTLADAPAPTGSESFYPGLPQSGRDLSPRSDARFEFGGATLSLASYTVGSASRSTSRTIDDTRWAAPLDGPDASSSYTITTGPRAFVTPAPLASRSGSPRDRLLGARSASPRAVARPRANVVASRGTVNGRAGVRGGSPRDAYAAQRRASGSLFGQTMASQAMTYRGTPYRSGGASPSGFDCSGLVYFLLRQRGFNPPRTAAGLASFGISVPKNQLEAGDIVLFANTYKRGVSHVGIYQGEGLFVHAPHSGARVRTDALFSGYYNAKYWGARRPK